MIIRALQLAFIIAAIAVIYPFYGREPVLFPKDMAPPDQIVRTQKSDRLPQAEQSEEDTIITASLPPQQTKAEDNPPFLHPLLNDRPADAAENHPFFNDRPVDAAQSEPDISYLAYYAYSEVPPDKKPADTILATLKDIPVGTPVEEIKHATDALGIRLQLYEGGRQDRIRFRSQAAHRVLYRLYSN